MEPSNTVLDQLFNGRSYKERRELCEALLDVFTSSYSDGSFYEQILKNYKSILEERDYNDRLHVLNKKIQQFNNLNKSNCPTSDKSEQSKFKHGLNDWFGTKFFENNNFPRVLIGMLNSWATEFEKFLNNHIDSLTIDISSKGLDQAGLALSILSSLWFIPRFLRNTAIGIKQAYTHGDFDYMQKHLSEWINDTSWLIANTITLGPSTGWFLTPLTNYIPYIGIGFYVIDFLNGLAKSHAQLNKIDRILENVNQAIVSVNRSLEHNKENEETKQSNLESTKDLQQLKEIKERLEGRRNYILESAKVSASLTVIYTIAAAISFIPSPITPLIGGSIALLAAGCQHYLTKYYLPRREVYHTWNKLELLHNRLLSHVEGELSRLNGAINSDGKVDQYKKAKEILIEVYNSKNSSESHQFEEKTTQALALIVKASKINRTGEIFRPESYIKLKDLLRPFEGSEGFNENLKNEIHTCLNENWLSVNYENLVKQPKKLFVNMAVNYMPISPVIPSR
ncbi:hypothetical protein L3V82_05405 [Thiotrichales bacterium 19S3-7]|nr:hypothetical protein [Thiotrichales bacterium 19S3-7]MCF6801530.1 hypothetical protein [Thiotrichales bacterium 19S3-11]